MEKLEAQEVQKRLEAFPDWSLSGDKLQRTFGFDDFECGVAFINRVAALADEQQHYPDIMLRYNKVAKVTLTIDTRGVGGLTEDDFRFARATDNLFQLV